MSWRFYFISWNDYFIKNIQSILNLYIVNYCCYSYYHILNALARVILLKIFHFLVLICSSDIIKIFKSKFVQINYFVDNLLLFIVFVCVLINTILDRKKSDTLEHRTNLGWTIIVLILIMEFFGLINFVLVVFFIFLNFTKSNKIVNLNLLIYNNKMVLKCLVLINIIQLKT